MDGFGSMLNEWVEYCAVCVFVLQIFLGWCGDQKHISAGVIYAICMGLCGIVTACVPLFKSYVVSYPLT